MISRESAYYTAASKALRQSADDWKFGERKAFVFTHLQGNDKTKVLKIENATFREQTNAKTLIDVEK